MKKSLWVLFCLMTACHPSGEDQDPFSCLPIFPMGTSEFNFNLELAGDYQIKIEERVLVNTCSMSGDLGWASLEYENEGLLLKVTTSYLDQQNLQVTLTPVDDNCVEIVAEKRELEMFISSESTEPAGICYPEVKSNVFHENVAVPPNQ